MHFIHQELHDFIHAPKRLLVAVGVILLLSVMAAQWLYPTDRTLPFAMIDGQVAGILQVDDLRAKLEERYGGAVAFKAGNATIAHSSLEDAGIIPSYESTIDQALAYPWWERMIPFSLVTRQWSTGKLSMHFTYDIVRIRSFVSQNIMPVCNVKATSASIELKNGSLQLVGGENGRTCQKERLETSLTSATVSNKTVQLPFEVVYPLRKVSEVKPLFEATKTTFANGISLEVDGTVYPVPAGEVLSWFVFQEDTKTHSLKRAVSGVKVGNYLEKLRQKYYKPPTARTVYLLDGNQQRQTTGATGRTIDITTTTITLKKALLAGKVAAQATTQTVTPETKYVYDYSYTNKGLQSLLQDLAREKGNYGITVIELDGRKRSANANGTQLFTTASTYKIFVAYSVLKEIEKGHITWGQQIRSGMNTEDCWAEMLVYSMNPCSWVFADMVGGWARIEQQARGYGMKNTYLNASNKQSTSNDEAMYFAKLEMAELLQGASRRKLLDTLKIQHYRSGIPAGTGLVVANKIGFLEGYLHDIGIVYAPKGRYVLGVMTYGGSWWGISDVARRVNTYMQR